METSCASCNGARQCAACRLKTRYANLRAENEALRASLGGIRGALERHDEYLQNIDEGRLVSDDVMTMLWSYQEEMRRYVSHK